MATKPSIGRALSLRIHLLDSEPEIWRDIVVDSRMRLSSLHPIIQTAMGWEDCHLYFFKKKRDFFGPTDDPFDQEFIDDDTVAVGELLPRKGSKLEYEYDLGDSWRHGVQVFRTRKLEGPLLDPILLDGAYSCPPEDCGGIYRYNHLLAIFANPNHPDHDLALEWLEADFQPDAFDVRETDRCMRELKKVTKRPKRQKAQVQALYF